MYSYIYITLQCCISSLIHRPVYFFPLYNIMLCQRLMLAIYTKFPSMFLLNSGRRPLLNFIQTNNNCETLVQIFYQDLLCCTYSSSFWISASEPFTTDVTTSSIVCHFLLSLHLKLPSIILFIFQQLHFGLSHICSSCWLISKFSESLLF